jgi:ssDNA-binding Zn-finger/Zn-ribbon topoisomerase 1
MTNIFIIVALLVLFFVFIQKYVIKHDDTKDYAYKKKGALLNMSEGAFHNALKSAVGEHGVVLAKVSMANVVTPAANLNKKQWFIANNRIAKNYFDFVVCDARTLEPRVIINIPLIGANIKHSYQVSKLRRLLAAHIDLIETDKEVRFCKKCGSPMVIKIASQGEFKGRRFFTCSRQPQCTYTENYNVVYEVGEDQEL